MKRKDKIKLLNELSRGTTSLDEVQPFSVEFWKRFTGELWTNEKSNEQITDSELQERKERFKNSNRVIFITATNPK